MLAARLLRLIIADYAGTLSPLQVCVSLDKGGMQATIAEMERGQVALLIRGTDERADWLDSNLRIWPVVEVGDTRRWHSGFIRHSWAVYAMAKGWMAAGGRLHCVTGHSLGGAVAQIVGSSIALPTTTFASPRPLYKSPQPDGARWVVNHARTDDAVPRLPPPRWGFKHVGEVVEHTPAVLLSRRQAHSSASYLEALS